MSTICFWFRYSSMGISMTSQQRHVIEGEGLAELECFGVFYPDSNGACFRYGRCWCDLIPLPVFVSDAQLPFS